jgi:hypothetical protein
VLIVRLVPNGSGYDVATAGPFKNGYLSNKKLLWQGEHPAPTRPSGPGASSSTSPQEASASEKPSSARGQSDSGVAEPRIEINFARIAAPMRLKKRGARCSG